MHFRSPGAPAFSDSNGFHDERIGYDDKRMGYDFSMGDVSAMNFMLLQRCILGLLGEDREIGGRSGVGGV